MKVWVVFQIHTWWHAGTGHGEGASSSAIVARTSAGLPFLPGRTVKGLLRDAARLAEPSGVLSTRDINRLFGSDLPTPPQRGSGATQDERRETARWQRALDERRYTSSAGVLRFGSAHVGDAYTCDAWERWAAAHERERELLFGLVTSTAISQDGVAQDKALRRIEVAVPLTLRAEVEGPSDSEPDWVEPLRTAASLLRAVGSHRTRGLGRATVTVEHMPAPEVT